MTIYRLHRAARRPADCTGAALAGGRWNSIGTPMLYAAEHLSLACLEILVHVERGQLPHDYVWSRAVLGETPELLAHGALDSIAGCQAQGDSWIRGGERLAVRVPSVIVPEEFNVLLNPNHESYAALLWQEPRPFRFDPRLFAAEPEAV